MLSFKRLLSTKHNKDIIPEHHCKDFQSNGEIKVRGIKFKARKKCPTCNKELVFFYDKEFEVVVAYYCEFEQVWHHDLEFDEE